MTARGFVERVLRDVGGERRLDEHRLDRLAELQSLYAANDVLVDETARALHRCCPSCEICWATLADRRPPVLPADPGPGDFGSIFWPWIGKQYRRAGVCIVTTNINAAELDWWSLAEEYGIGDAVAETCAAGERRPFGSSDFFWNLLSTAHAVLTSLDGGHPAERPPTVEEAGLAHERISRVQAIKCSPLLQASSDLPAPMRHQCPPRFAVPEIELLRPGVLVAMGQPAFETVQMLHESGVDWAEDQRFMRGKLDASYGKVDVLWLHHPASRRGEWAEGQALLVRSLRARPLEQRPGV